ncbi:hypothetical protein ACN47E_004382 [Coniothyrium glycines]
MLFIVLALLGFPFLTYYVSTQLFHRRAKNSSAGKTPPLVPYSLPGVFHTFSLAYHGPQQYFASLLESYGSYAPFSIQVGASKLVFLRDPDHVARVCHATSSKHTHAALYKDVFGNADSVRNSKMTGELKNDTNGASNYAPAELAEKYLTGGLLVALADEHMSTLSRSMHDKMFQVGTWTFIEDFSSFFQQVVTKCTMETLFGSAFLKQYPNFVKDFWQFDDAMESYIPGMPRILQSRAHEAPRERLLYGIEKWLKAVHGGSESARIGVDDPIRDKYRGSKFVQEADDSFARSVDPDFRARAVQLLIIIHSALIGVIYPGFWTIVEILRRPDLAKTLKTQIAANYSSSSARPDLVGIARLPIVQSIWLEVQRLRIATRVVRGVDASDCRIDDSWTIPQGSLALAFSQDIALNPQAWAEKHSKMTKKPLEEFWPERFLQVNKEIQAANHKVRRDQNCFSDNISLHGLESILLALRGDGNSNVLGPQFPQALQAATLVVFLNEFQLHLCDPDALDAATEVPVQGHPAYGSHKTVHEVAVRIRKNAGDRSR